ncbi:hypothetical protein QVD17_17068 [Tagetes erecta]|uniref:Uncharacterized protein n=1 Tax=Tagetes erecta TaxID=13708 RepID=A0AAD8P144_TARER|nr:hypothetical protein QVD17_17068 [Tagetes erecta]
MTLKPCLSPAPTYHPLHTYYDTEHDAPGPRCGHTLTALAQTKSRGPRIILFGGATAIGSVPSSAAPGIRLDGVTNSVHVFDVVTRKWTRVQPAGEPPSPRAAHAAAAVGTMVVFQGGIGPAGRPGKTGGSGRVSYPGQNGSGSERGGIGPAVARGE